MGELTLIEQLDAFVSGLRDKGVKSFKGAVPLGVDTIEIDIVFERKQSHFPETD